MPYDSASAARSDLEPEDADWSEEQARAAMDAFNGCYKKNDGSAEGDYGNCYAIARHAAKQAGGGES